jgi:serine phosphatase RsbU (regulator of sigma subunit)
MISRSLFRQFLLALIALMLLLPSDGQAQDGKVKSMVRSEYIWNFGRNIRWADLEVDSFHVSFMGSDSTMYLSFERFTGRRKIKKRPIKTSFNNSRFVEPQAQIIYVGKELNEYVDEIYNQIEGQPILLLTDSCQSPRVVMVNFSPSNPLRIIEVNEENINKQGLNVPAVLMAMSYKQREDWEEHFKQAESQLEAERLLVQEQRAEIAKKKEELLVIENEIMLLSTSLKRKEKTLSDQENQIGEQQNNLHGLQQNVENQRQLLDDQTTVLTQKNEEVVAKESQLKKHEIAIAEQSAILETTKTEVAEQQARILHQKGALSDQQGQIETQQVYMYFFIAGLIFIFGIALLFYRNYKMKKNANKVLESKNAAILQQNIEINEQKEEIVSQRDEIEAQREMAVAQRDQITEQNTEIVDSIMYAQRIQNAVLPPAIFVDTVLPEHFILNQPRDIVSGDFYWIKHVEGLTYLAVADCTGHGVPGAFMSMLGISSLNEIISRSGALNADQLLNELRDKIIRALHQTGKSGEQKDGMDLSVIVINEKEKKFQYCGANNPLYLITNGPSDETDNPRILSNDSHTLREIKGDKMPIGIHLADEEPPFVAHEFNYEQGDTCYLFSDGFADQFGGPKGKKFKYKPFKALLLENQRLSMTKQRTLLETSIETWRGDLEQVDDILIVGLHLP